MLDLLIAFILCTLKFCLVYPPPQLLSREWRKTLMKLRKLPILLRQKLKNWIKRSEVRSILLNFLCYIQYSRYELLCFLSYHIMCCRIWQIGKSLDAEKEQVLTVQEQQQPCKNDPIFHLSVLSCHASDKLYWFGVYTVPIVDWSI